MDPVTDPFELSGGNVCLDFVNTWADRGRPLTDHLRSLDQILAFATQTGLLGAPGAAALARLSTKDPAAAAAALARAREAREAIYGLCSARAAGRAPRAVHLRLFNRRLSEALPHLRLEPAEGGFRWAWERTPEALDAPLWPILRAAAELLASLDAARIRECAGPQCTWLFLDRSRAGTRRWCSMTSCGNRAKARRHYHRNTS